MNFWERNNSGTQNFGGAYGSQNGGNMRRSGGNGFSDDGGSRNDTGGFGDGNPRYAQSAERDMRQKFEQYSSKSEDQLLCELSALAARMKNEGTFDAAAIENLYATASPFLNDMQRQRMRQLIDMLVK